MLGTINDQIFVGGVGTLSPAAVGEYSEVWPNKVPVVQFQKLNSPRLEFHNMSSISPFRNANDPAKQIAARAHSAWDLFGLNRRVQVNNPCVVSFDP